MRRENSYHGFTLGAQSISWNPKVGPYKPYLMSHEHINIKISCTIPPPKGYLKGIRDLRNKYYIIFHLDKVMCGTGRSNPNGTPNCWENLLDPCDAPDIQTVGRDFGIWIRDFCRSINWTENYEILFSWVKNYNWRKVLF
ncbi:putative aminotransferase [Lachancea thermotolerans]